MCCQIVVLLSIIICCWCLLAVGKWVGRQSFFVLLIAIHSCGRGSTTNDWMWIFLYIDNLNCNIFLRNMCYSSFHRLYSISNYAVYYWINIQNNLFLFLWTHRFIAKPKTDTNNMTSTTTLSSTAVLPSMVSTRPYIDIRHSMSMHSPPTLSLAKARITPCTTVAYPSQVNRKNPNDNESSTKVHTTSSTCNRAVFVTN